MSTGYKIFLFLWALYVVILLLVVSCADIPKEIKFKHEGEVKVTGQLLLPDELLRQCEDELGQLKEDNIKRSGNEIFRREFESGRR